MDFFISPLFSLSPFLHINDNFSFALSVLCLDFFTTTFGTGGNTFKIISAYMWNMFVIFFHLLRRNNVVNTENILLIFHFFASLLSYLQTFSITE